jgi:hypothetical protein
MTTSSYVNMPGMKWCNRIKTSSQLVSCKDNTCVMYVGEYGDKFYVILDGMVSVLVPSKVKKQFEDKDDL